MAIKTNRDLCILQILLVSVTEMENVYCAVRAGSLNKTDYVSSLKGSANVTTFSQVRVSTLLFLFIMGN